MVIGIVEQLAFASTPADGTLRTILEPLSQMYHVTWKSRPNKHLEINYEHYIKEDNGSGRVPFQNNTTYHHVDKSGTMQANSQACQLSVRLPTHTTHTR
jgi:hypothetical protein